MPELHEVEALTVTAIKRAWEKGREERHGWRVPASQINRECLRWTHYNFWWVLAPEKFDGRMLRLFETGNIEEERLVADMRRAGMRVTEFEPGKVDKDGNPKQFGVAFGDGHGYGKLDGKAEGIPEAPKTIHVVEFKSHSDKSFKHVQKHGVEKSKPEHYGQMQIYMHKTGIKRALYLAVNKNTDEIYAERIEYDFKLSDRLERNTRRVAFNSSPPPRLSEDPEFFGCMFCPHKDRCHNITQELPEVNCRTCIYSEAVAGGDWICKKHSITTDRERQTGACSSHLYNPEFVNGQQVNHDLEAGWVEYAMPDGATFINRGPDEREDLARDGTEKA